MILFWIAMASLAIWLVLVFARDGFWQTSERDTSPLAPLPGREGLGVGWPVAADALSSYQPTPNPSLAGRGAGEFQLLRSGLLVSPP